MRDVLETLPEDKYPDDFFTFWNNESPDHAHYDNTHYGIAWDFDVNFYSNNPSNTYSILEQARGMLQNAGWIIDGRGYDVASDEPSHTGRGMNAKYLQV